LRECQCAATAWSAARFIWWFQSARIAGPPRDMAKRAGSLWVEGEMLGYVDSVGNEWNIQGEYAGASSQGRPGSLWVEGDNYLHYVGASGADYRCWWQIMHSDAATTRASVWIEGNYLYYSTPGGGKYWTHGDYTHS